MSTANRQLLCKFEILSEQAHYRAFVHKEYETRFQLSDISCPITRKAKRKPIVFPSWWVIEPVSFYLARAKTKWTSTKVG